MTKKEFEKITKRGEGEKPSPSSAYKAYADIKMKSAMADYNTGIEAMSGIYEGWQSPDEVERRKAIARDTSRKMLSARNTYGIDTYDDSISAYNRSLAGIDDIAKGYAYYKNGDAYRKAQKNYEFSQKYNGYSYNDIQKALSSVEDQDEANFLKGYTKFSSLEDFDQALASATGDYKKGLKREREAYEKAHRFDKYAELRNNADFETVLPGAMENLKQYETSVATFEPEAIGRALKNIAYASELSPEKQEVAAYILEKEGVKAYEKYMKEMTFEVRQNEAAEMQRQLNEFAEENPVLSTVANTLASPIIGLAGGIEQIGATLSGDTDPGTFGQLNKAMSEANSVVAQNIKEEAGWLPSFAYEVFTTGVPNRVGQMIYGKAYTAVMGMSSFATTYADEIANGADTTSALWKAFASGAIETLTELIPWDLAFGNGKTWYTTMAKQMFFEGSEEAIGALATLTYDALANGGYSEFQQKVQRYVEQGYERSQAESMAWKDFAVDTAKQFAIAALSVAPTTGTASITQAVQESSAGQFVNREMLGEIDNADLKKKYGDEWTQKASNREVYKAYSDYVGNLQNESAEAEKKATAQAIAQEYKISDEEATKWAEALYNGDKKMLKTHFGQALTEDVNNREGWTKAIDTTETTKIASKLNKAFSMIKTKDQVAAEKASKAIKTGDKNLVNGKEAQIISMTENKDGSYTVKTSEGEVNAKDVTVTEQKATALTYSANIENEAFKEAYVRYYAGEDIADYDTYARYLYNAGRQGIDYSDKTNILDTLGVAKAQAIYNVGALEALQEEIEDARLVDEVTKKYAEKFRPGTFKAGEYSNGKFKENKDFFRNLNRTQKRLYKIVESFSKLSGINVRTYLDRNAASENGQFIAGRDGGTIYINLAARPFADNAYGINQYVISTLSHELTHWLKANNREAYDILEEAVKKDLQKNNTFEKRLSTERETLLKTHENELKEAGKSEEEIKAEMEKYEQKKDLDEIALEEVVARACEDMLNDADTMQEVLSFADQDGLTKLQSALKKWFDHIRGFFRDLMGGFHAPNEVVADLQKSYAHLQELWVNGMKEAIAQNRREQKTTESKKAASVKKSSKITVNSTEQERYEELSKLTLRVENYNEKLMPTNQKELERIESNVKRTAQEPIKKLAERLGLLTTHSIPDLRFVSGFSKTNIDEGLQKLSNLEIEGKFKRYAQMLTCFKDVLQNSHLLEVHYDRYKGTEKENPELVQAYVLISAFKDGDDVIPVKLLVKEMKNTPGILYVIIPTETIKEVGIIARSRNESTHRTRPTSFIDISLSDILKEVKNTPKLEKTLGKYIPSQFSTESSLKSIKMDSEGRTLSEGQQSYFKNSKVVDDQGRLLVVYHGTPYGTFSEFKKGKTERKEHIGFWFSDSIELGKRFANEEADGFPEQLQNRVYEGYLNCKNPFVYNAHGLAWNNIPVSKDIAEWLWDKLPKSMKESITKLFPNKGTWERFDHITTDDVAEYAQAHGYDSVIIKNVMEFSSENGEVVNNSICVFDSNQFKSIDNENPTDNPDIRKSVRLDSVETIGAADVDTKTGTAVYSVRYTLAERYKELGYNSYAEAVGKTAADIAKKMGVSKLKAEQWIKAEESLASIILNDAENQRYLDYVADDRYKAIKTDTDYPQGTVDLSNLCRKREIFTKMFDSLQRENPDILFTAEDIAKIRQILTEANYEVACALCYVEDRRQKIGEIAQSFADEYKKALKSKNKVIYRVNSEGERKPLKITKEQASAHGLKQGDYFKATDPYIPNQYDLTTYQGFKDLAEKHPMVAVAFENYNNARGQSAARLIEGHAEYKREILKWNKSQVDKANNLGGLRVFSFSDFEAIHLIDIVQVVMDCSAKGVMIQAYTKVPSFANLVKDTNIKINRSLIPANVGSKNAYAYVNGKAVKIDSDMWVEDGIAMVDGKKVLAFDTVEGIDITDENFLDMSDNHNVGNVLVGISEKQIRLAMEDDFVDYIIPFHSNQAKAILEAKGIHKWDNFKKSQLDKKVNGSGKDHGINIYTDVINKYKIRNKNDFVRAFLNECKNQKYKPRFEEFIKKNSKGDYIYTEGYHKFLVDYKLFDKNGNILKQEAVKPDFDQELMNKILMADKARSMNMKFSDEIMDKVKEELSIDSRKSVKMDSEGKTLTEDQVRFFENSKARDEHGNLMVMYHGSRGAGFTVFNPKNSDDGRSLFFTNRLDVASGYTATSELFEPDRPMSFKELSEKIQSFTHGEQNLIKDGNDYVITEEGIIGEEPHKIFRGTLKKAQEFFIDSIEDLVNENSAVYKVYLNLENPLVIDAKGNYWNELPLPEDYDESFSDIDIYESGDGFEADWTENGESKHGQFASWDAVEKKFGSLYEKMQSGNIHIDDIYLGFDGNRIPTNTREYATYAQNHGYDGVIINNVIDQGLYSSDKFGQSTVMIAFEANQIKSVYNESPTKDKDIRKSVKLDSNGNTLTEGQQNYFKDSKVRDKQGRLKVMYHGTTNANFSVFNTAFSDDNISFFFTDNIGVATSYSNTQNRVDVNNIRKNKGVKSLTDLQEFLKEFNLSARKDGSEIVIERNDDGEIIEYVRADSVEEAYDNWIYNYAEGEDNIFGGVYEVYLNAKNPLVIKDEGYRGAYFSWDNLEFTPIDEKLQMELNKAWHTWNDLDNRKRRGESIDLGEYDNARELLERLESEKEKYPILNTTREAAQYAKDHGYDSVIIENVSDTGSYGKNDLETSTVVIVFDSNQIKSIHNENPTNDADIRKSTKLPPEAQKLVDELTLENKRLTEENTALKMEKGIEKAKAEKKAIIDKITEQSQVLSRWLLTNDKTNPVPQAIKEPLGKLLTSISFTKDDYEWRKSKGNLTKSEETLGQRMAKISQLLLEIEQDKVADKDAYDLSQLDWIPKFTTEFAKIKDAVAAVEARQGENFNLSKMSTADLESLSNMITALKSAITNMNKCLSAHNKESVSGVGQEIISYLDSIGQKKFDNRATQFLEIDNTVPFYFFKRLGAGGQKAFKLLMDGMNQYAFEAKQIEDYAKETFSGKDVNAWRNEVKTFTVDEIEYGTVKGEDLVQPRKKTIQMTVPQIMSLYCLSKRDQAINHLKTGGIKIGDFKVKGAKETTRQIENTTLTKASLETIINSLTAEQKEVADKLQEFMNTVCQKWGNEITMKRFGFKGMTEKNYFPIKVDQNQLSREARQRGTSLYQLLNMGFTKPINPNAKNPIEIFDIFEVFAMHSTEMAQYHSLALPVLDVIRIWNYKDVEMLDESEDKAHWHSVKASIENTLGAQGNRYIGLLLADMNGDVSGGRADDLAGKMMKNYKTAAVAANLQVAALQPLSYIRAGYMIDSKYLAKGMAMKSTKEALKWCGIAVWKEMGFYNTSIHRGLEHKIMQDESKKESVIEKGLYLAGKADEWTWSKLWNACLLETKDKYPALEGDDLYKKTAERLTEVIYGTQVVDSILTRSQIMRDKTMYSKMITAFQSEPTLALNVLMDAAESFSMEARRSGKQAALKKYGDTLRRAATIYLIGSAVESLLRAVIGKIRNYDGDEDDENLIVDFFKRFIEELNPLRKIPIIKDAWSILFDGFKVIFGWQYKIYTDTRMDEAIFENLGKATIRIGNLIKGKTINYKVLYEIAKGIDASGVPVSSTFRAFKVFWNNTVGRIWPGITLK